MTSVTNRFLAVDSYMKNAFSSTVKFDISHKSGESNAMRCGRQGMIGDDEEMSLKKHPPKEWELDVRALISSRKWLQNYGLKKNRLELHQLLPSIGFKLCDEYDETLKKPVSSRYGGGLFRQLLRPDGRTFNISSSKDKLLQMEKRLVQALYLFRRRLEWLTTESRRVFGVIEEKAVTIVLDIRNMSPQQFDQYRTALERVLREQVSQIAKFNLIRASEDLQLYSQECVPLSHDTLENAIQWMWNLDRLAPVSNTAAAEGILRALLDINNEAVYLFTEGTSVDSGREILKEKVSREKFKTPVHVVSFNCDSSDTIKYLKDFTKTTGGKFHAYAVVMELDAYEAQPVDGLTNRANIMLKRKTFGGIPPGAGVREDVVLIFEEMEDARNSLAQVRMLIEGAPEPNRVITGNDSEGSPLPSSKDEQYMTSEEWLAIYGLDARKLGLFDVLSGVAFKHIDGVVDIMERPGTDDQTNAVKQQKLINAIYCEKFPVVRWKDGQIVHVQVTPEVHRNYEEKVQVAIHKFQQRIDWLNKGSRALFGTIVEDQVYILIDTSASMQPSLGFVKQKIFVLMQEQLRHKRKVNFVTFNSKASGWKDRLVDISERSLQSAWGWIQNLSCWGSTNTYGAIQLAMSDPQTQAIYLLSDGRPDQPPKSIIAQVQMQKNIPIHTISFNCNDHDANQFLYELAEATGGRYHCCSENGPPIDQPQSYESIDLHLLKEEIKRGLENLDKLADLRDECTRMGWKNEVDSLRKSIRDEEVRKSAMPPLDSKNIYRPNTPPRPCRTDPRPSSAPPSRSPVLLGSPRLTPSPPQSRPTSAHGPRVVCSEALPHRASRRPKSAKASASKRPLVAGHTRTSLLRTLNSSGRFSPNEWLLPETKQLFQVQAERQRSLALADQKQEQMRSKKKTKLVKANELSSKQWLNKNGLVAKRLTILDALGSTFVPHKAKYISILDKYVVSKVFDEVLPIAHVFKNQQVRLVNPNGVNLKEYESKVKAAVNSYRLRLNHIVWNVLPESAKEEFGPQHLFNIDDHCEKLMHILEEAGWPVKEADMKLLVAEIARGEKFLRLSEALRKAASGEDENDAADDDDDGNGSLIEMPLDNSKSHKSSNSLKSDQSPPRSPARSHKSDDTLRSQQEVKDYEGLGQVIRSVNNASKGKVKESSEVIRTKVRIKLDSLRYCRVVARRDQDGLYYPGEVLKCSEPRHAVVKFDFGEEANVLTRNVIPTGGAVARPKLTVGDYVLIRVVNLESDDECYVPAVIQVGAQSCQIQKKFYSVIMYNGQKASTLRTYLIKISKERFELASMYIAHQQKENRNEVKDLVYVSPRCESKEGKETEEGTSATEKPRSRSPSVEDQRPKPPRSRSSSVEDQRSRSRSRLLLKKLKKAKRLLKKQKRIIYEQTLEKLAKEKTREQVADPSEDVDSTNTTWLIKLRKSLDLLHPGEEVLARWSDDGWYYRGIVRQYHGDYSYNLEDSTGFVERIWREDIISENDDRNRVFEVDNKVVALHPDFSFSYAPGFITLVYDSEVTVEFFDGQTCSLPWAEVYHSTPEKYKQDVVYIMKQENQLVEAAVIARDDRTGAYYPGSVKRRADNGHDYIINWSDGTQSIQTAIHIFSAFTRRPPLAVGDRVLALADPVHIKFLPGHLVGSVEKRLIVKFCDGEMREDIDPALCYWLSRRYFSAAVEFYKSHDPSFY